MFLMQSFQRVYLSFHKLDSPINSSPQLQLAKLWRKSFAWWTLKLTVGKNKRIQMLENNGTWVISYMSSWRKEGRRERKKERKRRLASLLNNRHLRDVFLLSSCACSCVTPSKFLSSICLLLLLLLLFSTKTHSKQPSYDCKSNDRFLSSLFLEHFFALQRKLPKTARTPLHNSYLMELLKNTRSQSVLLNGQKIFNLQV